MGSRKPSAKARQIQQFKASADDFGDLFDAEERRMESMAADREESLRERACESKNRYESRAEAEDAVAWCAEHGKRGLRIYRCQYCNGWHLTSK